MPTLPTYTKCIELGCKEVRVGKCSFCAIHATKKVVTEERWMKQQEYKSPFWKATKRSQLSRHPLCAACFLRGVICQADHVDHVFPWAQIGKQAFTRNIFQSLCTNCHSHKTQLEQRGVIEWYTHTQTKQMTLNDYGLMVATIEGDPD